ncbi:FUSC family protein [Pseudarthrobacter sp. P1]|uniref:FUSC family protein n=1 Tax=Pseudarthrobacter sp. P1 TaxID=3418418 RepID=UPI003CEB3068
MMAHVRGLHSIGPASGDHLPALRVALGIAVPSMLLVALGHPELVVYAVLGAFTGMYGRTEPHQLRLKHQAQAGAFLLAGVLAGTAVSALHLGPRGLVLVETVFAGLGSLFADKVRLRPNGPFFGILALGACASVPLAVPLHVVALVCAGSAAFSVLVGFSGWLRGRNWSPGATREPTPWTAGLRRDAMVHAGRYLAAVGVAGVVAVLSGIGHPHWAMAAAAVPLAGADLPSSVHRGIHRIVGTFLGLLVVAVVLFPGPLSPLQYFPGREALVLAVVVVLCQFPTELFMVRHYGLAMVFFTPVILLMTQLAVPVDPVRLVLERGLETVIGAVVGILAVVLIRRRARVPLG